MKTLKVLIVAAGGYGGQYVQALLEGGAAHGMEIAGVVEPFPASVRQRAELEALQVPWYDTVEAFYAEHDADLALISSPIQFHKRQVLSCLENGSHVLCEKPLCSSPEDLRELIAARDRSGRLLGVGYQWSWAEAVQAFKKDAIAGKFGRLLSMKTLIRWPRNTAYFSRGIGWAGKVRAADGTWILDSIAHNACGHYLHHMLFTAGKTQDGCAVPERVRATLLRANAIENFDTAMIEAEDADGARYLFLASHAVEENVNPVFEFRYEKAVVRYEEDGDGEIHVAFADGRECSYGGMGDRASMGSIHFPKALAHGGGDPGRRAPCLPAGGCLGADEDHLRRADELPRPGLPEGRRDGMGNERRAAENRARAGGNAPALLRAGPAAGGGGTPLGPARQDRLDGGDRALYSERILTARGHPPTD